MNKKYREKTVEEGLDETLLQPEETPQPKTEPKSRHRKTNPLFVLLDGKLLQSRWLHRQLPLILILMLLALILVANRYHVENLTKKKILLEEEIDYLQEQRIQMQKEYQESIKISRIAKELDSTGVQLISGPPYEIESEEK